MENKQQIKKENGMENFNGSRGLLIHNFRNIGVYKEDSVVGGGGGIFAALKPKKFRWFGLYLG